MAQRRMSRKSFRKSKGRKTRSMRKRTMGGADGEEYDYETGLGEKLEELQAFNDSQDPNKTINLTEVVKKGVERCGGDKDCQNYKYNTYLAIYNLLLDLPEGRKANVTAELDGEKVDFGKILEILGKKTYKHRDKKGGRKSRRKRKSRRR